MPTTKQFGVGYAAATTPLTGTETLSIVQGGITKDTTTQDIADLGGGGAWTTVKKTADEDRSATTTLADDNTLVLACAASTRYVVHFRVYYEIDNATMDFKYGVAYSGTTTKAVLHRRVSIAGAGGGTDNETTSVISALLPTSSLVASTFGVGMIELDVILTTNSSGTLSFQWAQDTSDAGTASVIGGSFMEYMVS